jgi:hypothetical protein
VSGRSDPNGYVIGATEDVSKQLLCLIFKMKLVLSYDPRQATLAEA